MIEITIDGKKAKVEERTTILNAASGQGIWIPTLCHHPALTTWGSCRVCLVEIKRGNRVRMVTACNYPIEDPIEILTGTERVLRGRQMSMELLLARCPNTPAVKDLATRLGVSETRFPLEDEHCILCGLCVRVCEESIGRSAITFANRGITNVVETSFLKASDDCIGCGACDFVCPTDCVGMSEEGGVRRFKKWHNEFQMVNCRECGQPITTRPHLDYLKKKILLPDYILELCSDCKRQFYFEKTLSLGHM